MTFQTQRRHNRQDLGNQNKVLEDLKTLLQQDRNYYIIEESKLNDPNKAPKIY